MIFNKNNKNSKNTDNISFINKNNYKNIQIKETGNSPYISVDFINNKIKISGKSVMINVKEFYNPIIDAITNLSNTKNIDILMEVYLEYFNTSSSKQIYDIFSILSKSNNKVLIKWYYDEDDDSIKDSGVDYSMMFKKIKFKLLPIY